MSPYCTISLPKAEWAATPRLKLVEPSSLRLLRNHVERFALYFLRELHTGSIQFEAAETPDTPGYVPYEAYLFLEQDRYVGACCFRDRRYEQLIAAWSLDWAWIHPYFRFKHHLTNAWPRFAEEYGRFHLAKPLSRSMQAFVRKVGWHEESYFTERTGHRVQLRHVHP
jgi:hypothetical protein